VVFIDFVCEFTVKTTEHTVVSYESALKFFPIIFSIGTISFFNPHCIALTVEWFTLKIFVDFEVN
jgi:hypothetical protein